MAKKDRQPARSIEWQRQQQARYRQMWRRQVDALGTPDDDRYKFLRGMASANDLGTARGTVQHTINPGLARHLDLARAGASFEVPPPLPVDPSVVKCLHPWGGKAHAYRLAAARLALAAALPDHSLVLELIGWSLLTSEHDLANAFDEGGREGWSRPSVHIRKQDACRWVREWIAAQEREQVGQAS